MKKLLLISALMIAHAGVAQSSLAGTYRISSLITDYEVNEYALTGPIAELFVYGNSVTLNADGTFTSDYNAKCGNDCFTNSAGTYTFPDQDHIRFVVDVVTVTGDCAHKNEAPHKDLGLYYVDRREGKVRFIKSVGSTEDDRMVLGWSDAIDAFDKETSNVFNFHPIPALPGGTDTTDAGMVAAALKGNPAFDMDEIKVLYSKNVRSYFKAILFTHKGKQHIVLCIIHSGYVGLYDPDKWPKN